MDVLLLDPQLELVLGEPAPLRHSTAAYTLAQLAVAVVAGLALLWQGFARERSLPVALAAFVLLSLPSLPALWDLRPWARRAEAARLALAAAGAGALAIAGSVSGLLAVVVLVGCEVSAAALASTRRPGAPLAAGGRRAMNAPPRRALPVTVRCNLCHRLCNRQARRPS